MKCCRSFASKLVVAAACLGILPAALALSIVNPPPGEPPSSGYLQVDKFDAVSSGGAYGDADTVITVTVDSAMVECVVPKAERKEMGIWAAKLEPMSGSWLSVGYRYRVRAKSPADEKKAFFEVHD